MTVSVFVGTSVDGFIARTNGDLDFQPPGGGEPHGYNEFIATKHDHDGGVSLGPCLSLVTHAPRAPR